MYDGLEIAASGDHLDLERAEGDELYLQSPLDVLDKYGLKVWAISTVRHALDVNEATDEGDDQRCVLGRVANKDPRCRSGPRIVIDGYLRG